MLPGHIAPLKRLKLCHFYITVFPSRLKVYSGLPKTRNPDYAVSNFDTSNFEIDLTEIGQGHVGGVETAGAMDAGAWMGRRRGQIHAPDRRPIAEIRERRAKEELLAKAGAAAAQVASHQVLVHGFQIVRGENSPGPDHSAKTRRQALNALFNPVGECFLVGCPAFRQNRRHVRISPQSLSARRGPARIEQRLLADYQIWIGRKVARPDLIGEGNQIGNTVAGMNDCGLTSLVR